VGSTDRRNTFCELLSWGLKEQGLSLIANVKAWCQYHPAESVMYGLQQSVGKN
jgi:hypothetical protein